MQQRQSPFKRNTTRVQSLFEGIRQTAPRAAANAWLDALERDAKNAKSGWRDRFDAWLLWQEQAGGIPATVAEQWRNEADACLATSIRGGPIVFCVLWTVLVALATLGSQSALVGQTQGIAACVAFALTGVIWSQRLGWLRDRGRGAIRMLEQGGMAVVVGACAAFFALVGSALCSTLVKEISFRAFKRQQEVFSTAPNGYPWIRDFARHEFGVDVVMNAPQSAWVLTTSVGVGTSAASMATGNDLCELSISRESVLNAFAEPSEEAVDVWLQGIMVHELAHCLDVRRDYAG